jgi:hypothetical protein
MTLAMADPKQANFWKNEENRLKYMKWLGEKSNFHQHEDWYKIKAIDLRNNGGT